jgi:hypothetical protein
MRARNCRSLLRFAWPNRGYNYKVLLSEKSANAALSGASRQIGRLCLISVAQDSHETFSVCEARAEKQIPSGGECK